MTENRRIVFNTLATYGRTVFSLALGLFSSRWVLMGLGEQDLGLFGIVGSLIVVIGILNSVLSIAVSRYYAFMIGECRNLPVEVARDKMQQWFNAAFSLHIVLPLMLMIVGYPTGVYAIYNWLVIPKERITACVLVFQVSMFTAFVSMSTAPFNAMYTAYQRIVDLSLFGVAQTVINFAFVYSMLSFTGDRLLYYSIGTAIIMCMIQGGQVCRAMQKFDACRICPKYFFSFRKVRSLFAYASWELFSCLGDMFRSQGAAFVINRYFGLHVNAAYGIANQVSSYTTSLSNAMIGALSPAVTSAEGAGDRGRMIKLAFRCCKFGPLMILIFCVPLIVEMDEVLRLWLTKPPEWTGGLCRCILIAFVAHKLGWGHHMAISAYGKIGRYHLCIGLTSALTLLVMIGFIWCGCGVLSIGYGFICSFILLTMERVLFARFLVRMSISVWLKRIVFPIISSAIMSGFLAWAITVAMPASFLRVCITTVMSITALLGFGWLLVLDEEERHYISNSVIKSYNRIIKRSKA